MLHLSAGGLAAPSPHSCVLLRCLRMVWGDKGAGGAQGRVCLDTLSHWLSRKVGSGLVLVRIV